MTEYVGNPTVIKTLNRFSALDQRRRRPNTAPTGAKSAYRGENGIFDLAM